MDHWTEHYFKTTAIYANDIVRKGELPHPIAVKYCPVDVAQYTAQFSINEDEGTLSEQDKYIAKAVKFAKENLGEVAEHVEVPEEKIIDILSDSIRSGWDDIVGGNTVGAMVEITKTLGLGGVVGFFLALDKEGFSVIGFAGLAAGATVGLSTTVGAFYYNGPREGLTGWGGDFNASGTFIVGIEWEVMFTGGNTGHYLGGVGGAGFAVSVEFQYAWNIAEKVF